MRKKKEDINSFLGTDSLFDGNLNFSGTVRIDGHFKGNISATGNLIVGPKGLIEADVRANSIVCNGEMRGRLAAKEVIDVRVPGKIFGDIEAPRVIIQEGVVFEGNCRTRDIEDITEDASNVYQISEETEKSN